MLGEAASLIMTLTCFSHRCHPTVYLCLEQHQIRAIEIPTLLLETCDTSETSCVEPERLADITAVSWSFSCLISLRWGGAAGIIPEGLVSCSCQLPSGVLPIAVVLLTDNAAVEVYIYSHENEQLW